MCTKMIFFHSTGIYIYGAQKCTVLSTLVLVLVYISYISRTGIDNKTFKNTLKLETAVYEYILIY